MQPLSLLDIMLTYKTKPCTLGHSCNAPPSTCPYSHGESDRRRVLFNLQSHTLLYLGMLYVPDIMPAAQRHFFCQNLVEYNYHIYNYKTKPCTYLEIADVCELGKYCPYIHPGERLDEIAKFRSQFTPPPAPFYSPIQGLLEGANGYIFKDGVLGNGKRKSKHIFAFPDGEEAYILGSQVDIHEDGENEFKNWTLTKNFEWLMGSLQEYICAFSNTNGGTIYLGITDDGKVVGTFCDRGLMDKLCLTIDQIRMSFRPMLNQASQIRVMFKKVVQMLGKKHFVVPNTYVIEFYVKEGKKGETYATYDGRVFIRLSASNRELVGPALIKYVKEKCV